MVSATIAVAALVPAVHASETVVEQASRETRDASLLLRDGFAMMQGHTWTFAPLRDDVPAGTTLTLDEGEALEALRADGWSITVVDNMMTVGAPGHVEGSHQIPVIVTLPDQSPQATFVTMHVDYLVDIPLSILLPALSYLHVSQSSTSSTTP